jgi:hypothetical protein
MATESAELTVERTHPEALVVAEEIITFARAGVRDPARLRYLAVEAIRVERRRSVAHAWALGGGLADVAERGRQRQYHR